MIGRLFQGLVALVLYFCLATIIAEVILANHLWGRWKIDRNKILQMVAVAQGLSPAAGDAKGTAEQIANEQPSYEEVLAARTAKDLNLQLREQAIDNAFGELRSGQQNLNQSQGLLAQQRQQYETELRTLQESAAGSGSENVRQVLESVKPKQAKELITTMLRNEETQAVVTLLRDMSEKKRAKVVAEFKSPEETSKIEEILRLIRTGAPEADLAKNAEKQLQGNQSKP